MWPLVGLALGLWWLAARTRRRGGAEARRNPRPSPRRRLGNPAAAKAELERAARDYRAFHGLAHRRFDVVALPEPPKALWKLGRALRIDYEAEPPSSKAGVQFTHEWGDTGREVRRERPILAVDAEGNLWLVRDKSRYRVNRRGIVG